MSKEVKTFPELQNQQAKKEVAELMVKNGEKRVIELQVKAEYFEYCSSLETDEKSKATWLVEADKTKVEMKGAEEALSKLYPFARSYN